jgi:hypothetical protein
MAQVRNEIYDENGLVRVEFFEVPDVAVATQIADKEAQLLAIYEEIQRLKTI